MSPKGITIDFKRENSIYIPELPGVYIFRDKEDKILYIGKAVNLRKRVQSYHRVSHKDAPKLKLLTSRITSMEFIVCATEKEALILEDALIKEHRPRYNVRLRDDKAYPFIKINTGHKYPGISFVRKRKDDKAIYFGPFTSSDDARRTIRFIARTFGIRTCSDNTMRSQKRPCIRAQIGLCLAPCSNNQKRDKEQERDDEKNSNKDYGAERNAYRSAVNNAISFLEGDVGRLLRELKDEMERLSQGLKFEMAARIRDQIRAIERFKEPQDVTLSRRIDLDCIGIASDEGGRVCVLTLLRVREGRVHAVERHEFSMPDMSIRGKEELEKEAIRLFLRQAYMPLKGVEVMLPYKIEDAPAIEELLREKFGMKLLLSFPQRGEKKRLIHLSNENSRRSIKLLTAYNKRWEAISEEAERLFNLPFSPNYIECIDISHSQGDKRVGSLVCFVYGKPHKERYRRYNLSTGNDDYAGIREVVRRRFEAIKKDDFSPDIIIIDGGRGQLSSAVEAATPFMPKENFRHLRDSDHFNDAVNADNSDNSNLSHKNFPIFMAIAKGRDGTSDKFFLNDPSQDKIREIKISKNSPLYLFFQKVRDEAHRFGITLHKKKMKKTMKSSILDRIEGVGPRRKAMLLKKFGGIEAIKNAPLSEIEAVKGITKGLAIKIKEAVEGIEVV